MQTFILNKKKVQAKTVAFVLAVAGAVALPQLFHAVGIASGLGNALGAAFLPMHLPVLLAGFLAGPTAGLLAGAFSPLVSFAISGMPAAAMLPFMMVELAGYGLFAGLLTGTRLPGFVQLLAVQAGGRALRAVAILLAIYGFGRSNMEVAQIWNIVLTGLPGILLQWAVVPLLLYRVKGLKQHG